MIDTRPDTATFWRALEAVPDPEVPALSVVDLGIVRGLCWVDREEAGDGEAAALDTLEVTLTPTYSGCPATEMIAESVRSALLAAGAPQVRVLHRHAPAWTSDWIGPAAREKLRAYGIAPPAHLVDDEAASLAGAAPGAALGEVAAQPAVATRPLRFHARGIACPLCSSTQVERLSAFGATACKALYRCLACREPFEYFKPI